MTLEEAAWVREHVWTQAIDCHSTGRKAAMQIIPSDDGALFDLEGATA